MHTIEWSKSSEEDRADLYRVMRAISVATGKPIEDLMADAMGGTLALGTDYLSNFRKGKIARTRAKLIHDWIARHHSEIGHATAPNVFSVDHTRAWEKVVDERANDGNLRLVRLNSGRGIVERADQQRDKPVTLRFGEAFCFELDSPTIGTAIAFQGTRGRWHPLPLGKEPRDVQAQVLSGTQRLPRDAHGHPIPLSESDDTGLHRFVMIIAPFEGFDRLPERLDGCAPSMVAEHLILGLRVLIQP